MNKIIKTQKNIIIFAIPILIIGLMIFITKTSLFQMNPDNFAVGITFDLLLIVPFTFFQTHMGSISKHEYSLLWNKFFCFVQTYQNTNQNQVESTMKLFYDGTLVKTSKYCSNNVYDVTCDIVCTELMNLGLWPYKYSCLLAQGASWCYAMMRNTTRLSKQVWNTH